MQDYLFHALDEGGAPVGDVTLSFEDDASAILHGLGSAFPHGCELWCRFRLVGRFHGPAGARHGAQGLAA